MAEVTADMGKKEKPSRGRVRRVAKWAGLVVCVVLVTGWAASIIWRAERFVRFRPGNGSNVCYMSVGNGAVTYERIGPLDVLGGIPMLPQGFFTARNRVEWAPVWWRRDYYTRVVVPIWMPLVLAAIPTVAIWYADRSAARRRRQGMCVACGYDRRGLVDGAACPECGAGAR